MEEMKLRVPTYNGKWIGHCGLPEFSESKTPVLVCEADGVRVVLGTHDYHDYDKPDIQIERRNNGWMIFLHPLGGGDPSGYVFFLDDGRSFIVKEDHAGATESIVISEYRLAEAKVDEIKQAEVSCQPTMIVDGGRTEDRNW